MSHKIYKSNTYTSKDFCLELQEKFKNWVTLGEGSNPLLQYPEMLEIRLNEFEFSEETEQEEKARIQKEEYETKLKTDIDFFVDTKIRPLRDSKISDIAWLKERHSEETERNAETTLTSNQYIELLNYTQDLRDLPAQITEHKTDSEIEQVFEELKPSYL